MTTQFGFDALNRQTRAIDPLKRVTRYEYDLDDRLKRTIDRDGRKEELDYDGLGRLTSRDWLDSTGASQENTKYTLDGANRLVSVSNSAGTVSLG